MSGLADLYPGYASEWISTRLGRLFARVGGKGPPLMLLHGYPQTHVMWHKVAPLLADRFTLIIPDLPGYGWSDVPGTDAAHTPYSKRAVALAMIELMEKLGHARFALAGHDRGGRVAYRLALDHPGRLTKLAVLDILPTHEYWAKFDRAYGMKIYHWTFLAQPAPLPETLIGGNPPFFFQHKLASWTKAKDLSAFDPRALHHYLTAMSDPLRIHASCEDYRAGATLDAEHDAADLAAGTKITAPLLVLWGAAGLAASAATPIDTWRKWANDVSGEAIDSGHFIPEENPRETARAFGAFFGASVAP
jgi:haloacetate dehalogenase